ncbi:uncharacterized protein LOC128627158 [Artibeus jamaicensis]|uniref:uncharacterized protein LOC128627158 n=1 Tax=Artibeus jamaicensis TaxID=9417 RepID=UPI00235B2325|nr:uncharacterized protein LOC128627158 [Artibeus jamaicensis]
MSGSRWSTDRSLRGPRAHPRSHQPLHPPCTQRRRATSRGGALGRKQPKEDQNKSPPSSNPGYPRGPPLPTQTHRKPKAVQARGTTRWPRLQTGPGGGKGPNPKAKRCSSGGGGGRLRHLRDPRAGEPLTWGASRRQGGQAVRARCGEEKRGSWKCYLNPQFFSHPRLCKAVRRSAPFIGGLGRPQRPDWLPAAGSRGGSTDARPGTSAIGRQEERTPPGRGPARPGRKKGPKSRKLFPDWPSKGGPPCPISNITRA